MDNLFEDEIKHFEPLAVRMRPKTLDEFYGQQDIVGKGTFLRTMIEADTIPSLLFYGPSGVGKTTLAKIIANMTHSKYVSLNATIVGIGELRQILEEAKKRTLAWQQRTILFLDEIHRFNKSQQDVLLPFVEDGSIILIGATTENPFFEINRPLLSRLRVISMQKLDEKDLIAVLRRALEDEEKGLGKKQLVIEDSLLNIIGNISGGDGRIALNLLEQVAMMAPIKTTVTQSMIAKVVGKRIQAYDKKGNQHYDTISAFIKSMRGSDPQATLHYLARMIEAGEDPNFIARRIVICAAEDIGLADPQALAIANTAAQAANFVGFPEARIILSEAALYLALAPKSNSAYMGINQAISQVRSQDCGEVPLHLRDAHYSGASDLGAGVNYQYAHDYPNAYVKQDYLPEPIKNSEYYKPSSYGREKDLYQEWCTRISYAEYQGKKEKL